jgi:hypothetical protein
MYQSIRYHRQIESTSIVATPVLDSATAAWVAAVVSNGGTVSAGRSTIINNLIIGLKADGIWTKLDRLWLLAAENEAAAMVDLVHDAVATKGSPAFLTDRGYTGNDSNNPGSSFIDTGWIPSSGPNFIQDSAHISTWVVSYAAPTDTSNGVCVGVIDGTNPNRIDLELDVTSSDGNVYGAVNENANSAVGFAPPATKTGFWAANRSGASASQIYKDGSLFASPNTTSFGVNSESGLDILCIKNGDSGFHFWGTPDQLAMASVGGSLSGTDMANFYNRLRTYMTAVGVP